MRAMLVVTMILAVSCGGASSDLAQRITDYRSTISSLNAAIDAHASNPAAVASATCMAAMTDYADQSAALIGHLQQMSGSMNQCMSSMGQAGSADFSAGCAAMQSELDGHVHSGCSAANLGAEMARHVAAMKALTGQEMSGMDELSGMMNRSSTMGMAAGCN